MAVSRQRLQPQPWSELTERRLTKNRSDLARFVQGDAARLPFADKTFAAVISNHSLEHFDDLAGALREIGRGR
jgi:ubiquinone/menaquinone biosynthesis C-methylase UbiE